MEAPDGSDYPKGTILKLKKSLYGLKQAPRMWNIKIDDFILSQGFKRCKLDTSVYVKGSGSSATTIVVYVDDLLIHDVKGIGDFKRQLSDRFKFKDLGQVQDILGMHVIRDRSVRPIRLSQERYIAKLVESFRIKPEAASASSVPMTRATFKTAIDGDHNLAQPVGDRLPFRSLLGGLLYANVCTRPDLSFSISAIASHTADAKVVHWNALMDVLKYVRDTQDLAITYAVS
jgi:hypothetical protein